MAFYGDGKHNENMEHIAKEQFEFYIDRKVTVWVREFHNVAASSYEEAKEKMIEVFEDGRFDETFSDQDTLSGTEESMDPGDNGGYPTSELYYKDGQLILANA
ncbi:hypothetical protein UFOVP449_237 [uncultured Caudovirales phage]|uniref:Uncharacterized protein n=1 Tax=uncultured Caudovirales phage TaxID=2100421 RepID=A0A6J5MBF2_9CAUD|nr:hypothetical protein UFOVP449_237 [uncultured Caudovirales phage]